ncbi:MAG: hypothetical protein LBC92_00520 [Rickettsiales bacterium]|jgi:protocatechuate 3,4-dioxygenase beta subunit|nr:hypothetical protein [Rickettsiales bacterium]
MTIIKFIFILFAAANLLFANEVEVVDIFQPKKQTPTSIIKETLSRPQVFFTGSDLTRLVGSFYAAVGELLYIKGKVTDAFGVPINNATVNIWQTNSAGKYQNILKRNSIQIDENFNLSGTARTDNLGIYGFKTVFPGYESLERAPHINLIITHKNFGSIYTEIYFEGHPMNIKDPIYMSYTEEERKMLTAKVKNVDSNDITSGKLAVFNIVMDGVHSYKKSN